MRKTDVKKENPPVRLLGTMFLLVLGLVALGFTLISVFTLSGPGPLSLLRRQVNEVA